MPTSRLMTMIVLSTLTLFSVGCSKSEQPQEAATQQESTGYVSENQQFVDQSNAEVKVDDPDALLDDLNTQDADKR